MVDIDNLYIHELLDDILEKIRNYGNLARVQDKNIIRWGKQITEEKFKLIPNLIRILSDTTSYEEKEKIILVIKMLLQLNENIQSQLMIEDDLPSSLINFIIFSNKEKKKLDLNAIFILSYSYLTFKYINFSTNYDLIEALFDSLQLIDEEIVLEKMVMILIDINSLFTQNQKNNFLEIYHDHNNSILINEIILRLYNKEENIENLYKILLLVMNIIDKEEKIVFYSSDLNAFIDISILKLETNDSDDLKCFILEILKRIIKSKEYIYSMYRLNYLLNFMQYFKDPNVNPVVKKKANLIQIYLEIAMRIQTKALPADYNFEDAEYEEGEDEEGEEGEEGEEEDDEGEDEEEEN